MSRKLIITILIIMSSMMTKAITLEQCKQSARENYPLIKQFALIEKSRDLNLSNATKAWIPGVNMSGGAVGFTKIIDNVPLEDHVYGGNIMVNQMIYDGGAVKAQKGIIKAQARIDEAQVEVNLYDINERVEQLFFGILMIDEHLKQVSLLMDNLKISEKSIKDLIQGGLANQSDLDLVNVNQIQAEQQKINLCTMRETYISMLGYFCQSLDIDNNSLFEVPEITPTQPQESVTLSLYDSKEALLDAQKKSLNAKITPTIGAFAADVYHSHLLQTDHKNVFIGGGIVRWNIGAFYTRKNDILNLQNQRNQINVQRETFQFNKNLEIKNSNGQIDNIRKQMELDQKTVELRQSLLEKSRKKVENGTETVNEMLRSVNAVSEANLQKAIHSIELLTEIYKLNTINGK